MKSQLVETWEINDRLNQYLLKSIVERDLDSISEAKGRTVGEQFAHIHNVRLLWLKQAAPDLLTQVEKIEKEKITKAILSGQLAKSGAAMAELINRGVEEGKIKGFKPHPTAFIGYIIAHESHHRSQIILLLKLCGHPVDKKILFGLWEWGTR